MKKVVLLTGVLAAGLAVAPVNAKAASAAPQSPEITEDQTDATKLLEGLLQGLNYDLAAIKEKVNNLKDEFKDIEPETRTEALEDIKNIEHALDNTLDKFNELKGQLASNEIDEATYVEKVNTLVYGLDEVYGVHITRDQAQKVLYTRYLHLDQDWKNLRAFQQKGDELWNLYLDIVNSDEYKQVDEIDDVIKAHDAVNAASKAYRTGKTEDGVKTVLGYFDYHANRTKAWNCSNEMHTDANLCLADVNAQDGVNALYADFEAKYNAFKNLVNKYQSDRTALKAQLDLQDPAQYTDSKDGKATVKAAQKAAQDFIETFNAANPTNWRKNKNFTNEDGTVDPFKTNEEYNKRAGQLIDALNKAVTEAKNNENAWKEGTQALNNLKATLSDIKTTYWNKKKENTDGYVYRTLISGLEGAIADAETAFSEDYNKWTDLRETGETEPNWWNAIDHLADVTKDGVKFADIKNALDTAARQFKENEEANAAIHVMKDEILKRYQDLKDAVNNEYPDVTLAEILGGGMCDDERFYLGTADLDNLVNKFIEDEQKKYDEIESKSYLEDESENGPAKKQEVLDSEIDLTWNHIATKQCSAYLNQVYDKFDLTHKACEAYDNQCDETDCDAGTCKCSEEDKVANPCGWCDQTAHGMHDALIADKTAWDGKVVEWHFATEAMKHVAEVKKYHDDAFQGIADWEAEFKHATDLHVKNLNDLKVIVDKAVHNVHEVYADAKHDLDNYKEGDLAAANLWAQDKYGVDFKGYVQLLEELYETALVAAEEAYTKHHYTELKGVGAECDQCTTDSDYRVAVNKNIADYESVASVIGDLETRLASIVISDKLVYGNDYETLDNEYQRIAGLLDTARADASNAYNEGKAAEYSVPMEINSAIAALQAAVKDAEKFYADNVKAAQELTSLFDGLKEEVTTAPVGDVYASDAEILEEKRTELLGRIAVEAGYVAADLADGKVLENYETTKGAYETLLDDVKGFEGQIKDAEKYLVDSKAKAVELTNTVDDLVVLLRSALPGDVYENVASDKDLETLLDLQETLLEDLLGEKAAIAADCANRAILDKAADHEAAISALSIRVSEFQGKVKEYEQFKADNQAARDALVNDLSNLLVVAEGLKKYGDVYEEGVEGGLDAYSIDRAIENLENAINGDLNFLQKIDYPAGEVLDNVLQYKAGIETYKQDIESIKEQIADAEQLYAANYRALNNLEELIMAEKTVLENTKAMCACNECNEEDTTAVNELLGLLGTILDNVYDSFYETKDLAIQEGAFKGQVDLVKDDAANLLALIQLHLDTAQNDLRVYNTLQALLDSTVGAEMLKLEAEEGYKCFANREAYHNEDYNPERPHFHDGATTNPNVKYGNELTDLVNNLKAEIDRQHSHEGGHTCEENKLADVKAMNDIVAEIQKTIAAVKANEAAHKLLKDRFEELYADALAAYNFWHQYYGTSTLITHEYDMANWIQEWNGEFENGYALASLENSLHDYYVHGNAANVWTVDGQGKELNDAANNKFAEYDEDLANDRNEFAHTEALNHVAQVKEFIDTYYNNTLAAYTYDGLDDPFVKEVLVDWRNDVEGEYGLYASLNLYKGDIEAAYEEGVLEDAINIDNHNTALGIHQQLDGVLAVLTQIEAEYAKLFEDAHHLTNGKTLYSDMEYVTIGFFRQANVGLGEQAQEMFKKVTVNFDPVEGNIGIYDMNWLETVPVDPTRGDVTEVEDTLPEFTQDILVPVRDENDYLVHQEGLGLIPAKVGVLSVGDKSNELTFTLNDKNDREVVTLAAGAADITFKPGSLTVVADQYGNEWTTKHNVYIEVNVEAPQVENTEADVVTGSNKLVVRLNNPIDLTYTINSLVARTNDGTEFSYADRVINYAANTLEFNLPEGTTSVEIPEGFFTFRTGENTIARSAAMVVTVGGTTSIESLIAMGEKAQIFDLQGRRVKAEALISGTTYVVNGEKVMVK